MLNQGKDLQMLYPQIGRTLDIVLMVDAKPDENRHVNSGQARGLTLGDFLLGGKE